MITLINAGLSFDKVSFVVSGLGFSSFVIRVVVPLRPGTDTETISWSKNPETLCEKKYNMPLIFPKRSIFTCSTSNVY